MNQRTVVLITGASSGIGKTTAETLAKAGFSVYGAARRISEMAGLEKFGGHPVQLDVTDFKSAEQVVNQIISAEGQIDILINNAGFGLFGSVEDTSMEDAKYQYEVNVFAMAKLTQLVVPHMRKQGSGKIINISSMAGKMHGPLAAWYHSSKHAVEGFSDCLRLEVKPFGIDVVIIRPGFIETHFGNNFNPLVERSKEGAYRGLAKIMAKSTEQLFKKGNASPPEVITNAILDAINSKRPKRFYEVGKFVKPTLFIRKWMGDAVLDKIIMSQLK